MRNADALLARWIYAGCPACVGEYASVESVMAYYRALARSPFWEDNVELQ